MDNNNNLVSYERKATKQHTSSTDSLFHNSHLDQQSLHKEVNTWRKVRKAAVDGLFSTALPEVGVRTTLERIISFFEIIPESAALVIFHHTFSQYPPGNVSSAPCV